MGSHIKPFRTKIHGKMNFLNPMEINIINTNFNPFQMRISMFVKVGLKDLKMLFLGEFFLYLKRRLIIQKKIHDKD